MKDRATLKSDSNPGISEVVYNGSRHGPLVSGTSCAMTTNLLSTKLYIPTPRSNLVPRPRLIERLNACVQNKLTLISAPAGFGKTTLLSHWIENIRLKGMVSEPGTDVLAALKPKCHWLSLDDGDNDLASFMAYLVAALNAKQPS